MNKKILICCRPFLVIEQTKEEKKGEYLNNLVFIRLGKEEAARILQAAKIGKKTLEDLKKAKVYNPQSDKRPKIEIPIDLDIHFHSSAILKKLGVYSDPDIDWIQYPEDFPIESIKNDPDILQSETEDANTYKDDIRITLETGPEGHTLIIYTFIGEWEEPRQQNFAMEFDMEDMEAIIAGKAPNFLRTDEPWRSTKFPVSKKQRTSS